MHCNCDSIGFQSISYRSYSTNEHAEGGLFWKVFRQYFLDHFTELKCFFNGSENDQFPWSFVRLHKGLRHDRQAGGRSGQKSFSTNCKTIRAGSHGQQTAELWLHFIGNIWIVKTLFRQFLWCLRVTTGKNGAFRNHDKTGFYDYIN